MDKEQFSLNELERELLSLPYFEKIEKFDTSPLYPELEACWFLIFPEANVYRFLHVDENNEEIEYKERFRPIILLHGIHSSHLTWNWMAQHLWADGFRNIFAVELFSTMDGIQNLFDQLTQVIDLILEMLPNYKFVTIIGHSLGGLVSRYYLKKENAFYPKVRLCVTIATPHWGVFHLIKPITQMILVLTRNYVPSHVEFVRNFLPRGRRMTDVNKTLLEKDVYMTTMVNLHGSVPLLGGTDGVFKSKPVSDMMNIIVRVNHFRLHKNKVSYLFIKNLLLSKLKVFKLRLLYIQAPKGRVAIDKEYFLEIYHRENHGQRYPTSGFVQLKDQTFVPINPLIIFVGMSNKSKRDRISIKVFQKRALLRNLKIFDEEIEVPLSSTEKQVKYIVLTAPNCQTQFSIAIFSYNLKHTYYEE